VTALNVPQGRAMSAARPPTRVTDDADRQRAKQYWPICLNSSV